MHEVSFQDKEKEHLTRLQDAEEMKVRAPPLPPAQHAFGLGFLVRGKSVSFRDVCGSAGESGEGPIPGNQSWSQSVGWLRSEMETEVSRNLKMSLDKSYVMFVHFSSLLLTKRERVAPASPCLGHAVRVTPEEMFVSPLNGS